MNTYNQTELQNTVILLDSVKKWFETCDNLSLVEPPNGGRPKPARGNLHNGNKPAPRPAAQPRPLPNSAQNAGAGGS